jgi:transcription-repair coupling factor (superfamily II helicase)
MECLKWKQTKHDKQPTGIVLSQCHRNPNVLLFKQKFFGKGGYRKSYNSCPAMPYRDLVPNSSNLLPLPALPKPGARLDVPSLAGSSDALALAEIAGRNPGKLLAVITASAADAQRLLDEIPWFAPNLRVRQLPDWETLPYDHFSPHQDLVSERLATLWSALQGQVDILLVPASTAVNRLAPPEFMAAYTFEFRKAQKLDAEKFRSQVTLAGYAHVTQVVSPGEYSIRGGLIDLFPMGSQLPYRLDLFDDEIESIKTFDVDTQRTVYPVPEVRLLPAREFPMDDKGRTHFRQAFRERFEGDPAKSGIYKDISRYRQRRHRVLPAAVLRRNRQHLRLPAEGRRFRHPRRCAGRHCRLLERHPLALQHAAGRQGPAAAAAGRVVPDRRSLLHRSQILRSTGICGQNENASGKLPNIAVDRRATTRSAR